MTSLVHKPMERQRRSGKGRGGWSDVFIFGDVVTWGLQGLSSFLVSGKLYRNREGKMMKIRRCGRRRWFKVGKNLV
jgi:hypothetical protein